VGPFHNPAAGTMAWISFLLLSLFPSLPNMRNIPSLSHGFLSRLPHIGLVCTKMLFRLFLFRRPIHHDVIQCGFQNLYIMHLGSGCD
jgi:hypothetical protein